MKNTSGKLSTSFTALKAGCRGKPTLARIINVFAMQASKDEWTEAATLNAILDVCAGEDYKGFAKYCTEADGTAVLHRIN